MEKIVECVPNISEGKNKQVIADVVEAIKNASEDIDILDVDPGFDTNRTVITFVGSIDAVLEGAFACIKKSYELIDMSKHKGAHPRQGTTDVCPFIPVSNVTMDECIDMAKALGKRVAKELNIPVYLYGYSASSSQRQNLAFVRKGEYEGLKEKLPSLKPDFGPTEFTDIVKKAGAINISARDFLIAYNVNLNTRDKSLANKIAFNVREAGKAKRDNDGKIIRDEKGNSIKIPGRLKEVKGIGWYIDEYQAAQVSVNLTNYKITPLYKLFETCVEEANDLGLRVTGSELVGLIPKEAMLEVGKFYLKKAKRSTGVCEKELIHIAVKSLGLNDITPFDVNEKIIEYKIAKSAKLCNMKLSEFIDEVSKDSVAPGGGSVAALAGALGAGLGSMVSSITPAKNGFEHTLDELSQKGDSLIDSLEFLKKGIDLDTDAFNEVITAMRLPKKTDVEIKTRKKSIEDGYKSATLIPFETAKKCVDVLSNLIAVAKLGNPNSASDVGVGALMAHAGFCGAMLNVNINLANISDSEFVKNIKNEVNNLKELANKYKEDVLSSVNESIKL